MFRIDPLVFAGATLVGIIGAALGHHWLLDPSLRATNPEDYPIDVRHWVAHVLFTLTFNQLFLLFAPLAWAMRLFRNEKVADMGGRGPGRPVAGFENERVAVAAVRTADPGAGGVANRVGIFWSVVLCARRNFSRVVDRVSHGSTAFADVSRAGTLEERKHPTSKRLSPDFSPCAAAESTARIRPAATDAESPAAPIRQCELQRSARGTHGEWKTNPIRARLFHNQIPERLRLAGLHLRLRIQPAHRGLETRWNQRDESEQREPARVTYHVGLHHRKISLRQSQLGLVMNLQEECGGARDSMN